MFLCHYHGLWPGLLLGIFLSVLSVCTCSLKDVATLPSLLLSTNFGTCSYHVHCLILPLFPYIC
jgi:hypothetical protein